MALDQFFPKLLGDARLAPFYENVDMTKWNGAYWLVHRTARSQVLGPNSSLHVYKSADGLSFTDVATPVPALSGYLSRTAATYVPCASRRPSRSG